MTERTIPRSLPLERKLPLLILGLFALVLSISLAVSYYEVRHSAELSAADRLAGLSQVLGSLMEQQSQTRLGIMRRVARDTAVQAALRNRTDSLSPSAQRALSALIVQPADTASPPGLFLPEGRRLGKVRLSTPSDQQQIGDELRAVAGSHDSVYVSHIRARGTRATYYNAVPVRAPDQTLLGFVVQERRIATNPRGLAPLRGLIGSDIEFFLRNAGDNTWVQLTGASVPAPSRSEAVLDSLRVNTHGAGDRMLASTAIVKGTPFLVTVERPMRAILDRPFATIRILIVIGILLAVAGAALVWVLTRRLVRPLGELTGAAEGIAHGRYSERVKVTGRDEIGRLAGAFNRMAEQVESSSDESRRALERLTHSAATQAFLAEASRILAGSLSDELLLTDLTRYCIPRLGDYCSVYLVDDEGMIRRVESVHRDPAQEAKLRELVANYEIRLDGPSDLAQVIRTRQPLVIPAMNVAALQRAAPNSRSAEILGELQPRTAMCIPLVARGHSLGAIAFTMSSSERQFTDEDVEIATEIARRAAVTIDNSMIYRRSIALRMEAEAASSAKSDFLAKMSHEIRTPINAMMGYAELMEMGVSGPTTESQKKQLGRIRASGDHLTALVNEILDLAKIEAGSMAVKPTVSTAGEAAEMALAAVRPIATSKGVNLLSHIDGDPRSEYLGDPQRVHQILTNLLSNAIKFTPPNGTVSISCGQGHRPELLDVGNDWVCITVQDTGIGIEPADLDRIFQPFVQVDAGYTRSHGGTGLGLTISRSLAHLMGGEITVESVAERGSSFTLWLPCPVHASAGA